MNYIIFDLEATCWKNSPADKIQEIIEIGAVKLNQYGEKIDEFSTFVKPIINPNLSFFCQQLTSITQSQIDRAANFEQVIDQFQDWIGVFDNEDYLLCSWGAFDQKALIKDCSLHQLDTEWLQDYINLKAQYRGIKGLARETGLRGALNREKLEFDGTHHRGIDDARNLVKIFQIYFDEWQY